MRRLQPARVPRTDGRPGADAIMMTPGGFFP